MAKKRRKKKKSKKSNKITPLVGIIVTSIIGIIGIIVAIILNTKPVFYIEPPHHLNVNQGIIIRAANWKADRNEDLDVIFEGIRFIRAGKPIEKVNNSRQRWKFYLKKYTVNPDLLKPGKHSICFAFVGEEPCKEQNIYFISEKKFITSKPEPIKRKTNATLIILIWLVIIGVFFLAIYFRKKSRKASEVTGNSDTNIHKGLKIRTPGSKETNPTTRKNP
jgi:preprotein translocase subunit YajC